MLSLVSAPLAWLRRNPIVALGGGVVALAAVAFVAFGVFGVHTLFTDDEVSEANPFAVAADDLVPTSAAPTTTVPGPGGPSTAVPSSTVPSSTVSSSTVSSSAAPTTAVPSSAAPTTAVPAGVRTLGTGNFESRDHPASGTANVITDGNQTFLRLEDDFATDNGPDLNVYLSKAPITAASGAFDDDFIDLGDLKGNIGSQNYELDPDIDLAEYQTVVIWCVRFGVAFGAAPLT